MPRKYDPETKAKAIRLVIEHGGEYASGVGCGIWVPDASG